MKIISGNLSGRLIKLPKGRATRPTSARAKESLFNFLTHGLKFNFDQTQVLDLFAGSGSLGIESLSRGAKFCSFIDNDINSIITIKDNLKNLNLEKQSFVKKKKFFVKEKNLTSLLIEVREIAMILPHFTFLKI